MAGILEGKRVVLVSHWDFNLYRFRREILEALVHQGAQVYVAVPPGNYDDFWAELGVTHLPFEMDRASLGVRDAMHMVSQLRAHFRRVRPHLVHTFMAKPNTFGTIAAHTAGVRAIICSVTGRGSFFGGHMNAPRDRMVTAVLKTLYAATSRMASRTIFLNQDDVDLFTGTHLVPMEKAVLIRSSGVNVHQFSTAAVPDAVKHATRTSLNIDPDAAVVLMVARLLRSKGVPEFLQAAARLRARFPSARFVLAGAPDPGNPESLTSDEVAVLARESGAIIPGHRSDIAELLAISTVYVLPTTAAEGVPRTVLEAMAMGLPVITSDMPGCRETVTDGVNGFLVPPGDVEAICRGLEMILSDPITAARMGAASRENAEREFAVEAVVKQHIELYEKVLAGHDSRVR